MMEAPRESGGYLSLFDVDARAELRRLPLSAGTICPRIGEHVDLESDVEHGGGVYIVIDVHHLLRDEAGKTGTRTVLTGIRVHLKPQHSLEIEELSVRAEIPLEEIIPEGITIPTAQFDI